MTIIPSDSVMNMKSESHPSRFSLSRRDFIRSTLSTTAIAMIGCSRSGQPINETTEMQMGDQPMVRPTSKEAATRLVILKYHILHASLPPGPEKLSEKEKERLAQEGIRDSDKFWRPLKDSGLWPAMSPKERECAEKSVLAMTSQQIIDASWRMESAVVLMWALNIIGKPPSFESQSELDLLKQIPNQLKEFIAGASLRSAEVIDHYRDVAELWHWRSRTRQLKEEGRPLPKGGNWDAQDIRSYDDIVRKAAQSMFDQGDLPSLSNGDFPVNGKAYRDLAEEEWSEIRSITMERHFAANWLCGEAPGNQWDETPTDT
jgi:uncharacterized protein DUF4272